MKNKGSTPILTNLVGVHHKTSTQNLKQICAVVPEKNSKMGYYIVINSFTLLIYMLHNYVEAH